MSTEQSTEQVTQEESQEVEQPQGGVDAAELAKQLEALKSESKETEVSEKEIHQAESKLETKIKTIEEPQPEKSPEINVSFETDSTPEVKVQEGVLRSRASIFHYEKAKLHRFIEELFQGMSYQQFINSFISNNDVVIFSKTYCTFCEKVHTLLEKNRVEHVVIYVDLLESHGPEIMKVLTEITGLSTVPNIFIRQKHIGGYCELKHAFQTGYLDKYLRNEFDPYDYDLIIIGGGSGGLSAALEAAKYKKKIALCDYVEPTPHGTTWGLGGTCTNVGCIPKKIMHHAALTGELIIDAINAGWKEFEGATHDWEVLINGIQNYIKLLNWNYRKKLKLADVDYFNVRAKFIDPHTIKLETNDPEKTAQLTGKCFIIAVGCRPTCLKIEGAKEYCITSDDFFSLKEFPGKTLIIGGSYVALECAGVLNHLGVCVTVMVRSITLRGFDRDMAKKLEQHMEIVGVTFVRKCIPLEITKNSSLGYHVKGCFTATKETYEDDFDTVMMAMGRKPNTSHLGLCKINVEVDKKSRKIITNRRDQTNIPHIFAIGDVALDRPQLTPVAIRAGKLLANRLFDASETLVRYKYIPTAIFTPLEYGCVGESEESARERYGDRVVVWQGSFDTLETLVTKRSTQDCFLKLVCVRIKTSSQITQDRVIGFHILCYQASEIIVGFALAIIKGLYKHDFDAYPTTDITVRVFSKLELKQKHIE